VILNLNEKAQLLFIIYIIMFPTSL